MKLIRYGPAGREKPGIISASGKKISVSRIFRDYNEAFFEQNGIEELRRWMPEIESDGESINDGERIGPCIARPSKIICVGLNYAKHAAETGAEIPSEPVIFFKSTSALCGPFDNLVIPRNSVKTDWEVELAVVIGKRAAYINEEEASSVIAGYTVHNDYSERHFQLERNGQWVKGKSADSFAPVGPYLMTSDEVGDPNNLNLWLTVNGRQLQKSNTSDMIFPVYFLVSYISNFMTLFPGDIISTGTPEGVGLGLKPPVYLKPGDVIELGIEKLGHQRQVAEAFSRSLTPNNA